MARRDLIEQGEKRRAEILAYLRAYIQKNGWAPTIQEVADAVGLVSPNSTRSHLHRLAEDGFLKLEPHQARAIALVDPAPDGWKRGDKPPRARRR